MRTVGSVMLVLYMTVATGVAERPNFVLLLTDDQGWADAAFAGHPYLKMPALDRLVREGT